MTGPYAPSADAPYGEHRPSRIWRRSSALDSRVASPCPAARSPTSRSVHGRMRHTGGGERDACVRRKGANMARTLSMSFTWQGPMDYEQACAHVHLAEEAGVDTVWVAEAWGRDCFTIL